MTRAEKTTVIEELAKKFTDSKFFYVTDCSELTVEKNNQLRRLCFEKKIELKVVKNTLIQKALEKAAKENSNQYEEVVGTLKGFTALMFTETGNEPAKLIKKFRDDKNEKPILKAAFIDGDTFVGDDQVDTLAKLKSKNELIADVIALLESPMKNVLGALQSGGNTIGGILKALEEREG